MVPKKSKSKRLSCRQKYKIQKKVREHHRKSRKDGDVKPRSKKDPGIPNLFPLKEKMLQEISERKQMTLEQLAKDAQRRAQQFAPHQQEFDNMTQEEAVMGDRDNSRKAYYKEFKKVVQQADVILEVLDARDPLGCRTKQIEEMIMAAGINKRIILVLNKIDLVPREAVEQWLKFLRNEFPTIAFKASTQKNGVSQAKLSTFVAPEGLLNSSECLGADTLMKLLKNYCRNANIKTSITVGVIGYPNVGKSSVINSLKRSKVCGVGSTPGLTKATQEIYLDKNIKLIDCPGIVFGKPTNDKDAAMVMLRNCVKVELIEDPIAPVSDFLTLVDLIVGKCTKDQLMHMYNVPYFNSTQDFLISIARLRGRIKKGGIPDLENAARSILQDWNAGRIPFYTLPPKQSAVLSSEIVSTWTKEFELGDLVQVEGKDLANVRTKNQISQRMLAIDSSETVAVDMDMEALPDGYNDVDEDIASEMDYDSEESEEEIPTLVESMDAEEDQITRIIIPDKKKKVSKENVKEVIMTEEEQQLNPQHKKNQKKELKKQKKNAKRAAHQLPTDDYDFGEYFGLPDEDVEM